MPVEDHVIHLQNGRLAPSTPPQRVKELVERAVAAGDNGVVVHFHGGLVNYHNGMATARSLHTEYLEAEAYPLFFIWESGLIETITRNLDEIRQEELFALIWKRLANIVLRKVRQTDGDRSTGVLPPANDNDVQEAIDRVVSGAGATLLRDTEPDAPEAMEELSSDEEDSLFAELEFDVALNDAIVQVSNGLRTPEEVADELASRSATVKGAEDTLMDPRTLDQLVDRPDPTERGFISTAALLRKVVAIASRVIRRFVQGRDHGFHATIVEEILRGLYLANAGELVWSQMKKDTADAFQNDPTVFGGTAFLAALNEAVGSEPWPRITLIGHSTGAVYISEFLEKADEILPASVKFDIIFEAPASTMERTATTIRDQSTRIDGFRMFTMNDDHERSDQLVPLLYPHSLLYFVSGVVESNEDSPIVGMHRFYDKGLFPDAVHPDVKTVRDFVEDRAVWAVTPATAPAGMRSEATTHTAFDYEDDATLTSVKQAITSGFRM